MRALLSELSAYRRRSNKARNKGAALQAVLDSKTVFIHVPKCGGKSVITGLYRLGEHDWFGHPDINYFEALLGPKRFASFTKFTVLRDPVSRCRSAFYFVRQGGFGKPAVRQHSARLQEMSFDAFVQEGQLADYVDSYLLFRPQHRFICNAEGKVMVDHLCNMAHMSRDLQRAVGHILPVDQLRTVNASHYSRTEPVSAQSRKIITELYARDMELIDSQSGAGT
jgi:hypothetical protein